MVQLLIPQEFAVSCLGTFAWGLAFENLTLGTFVWELAHGFFSLGTFPWELCLRFSIGSFTWELPFADFGRGTLFILPEMSIIVIIATFVKLLEIDCSKLNSGISLWIFTSGYLYPKLPYVSKKSCHSHKSLVDSIPLKNYFSMLRSILVQGPNLGRFSYCLGMAHERKAINHVSTKENS